MPSSAPSRPRLRLTRRGRLVRTVLVLVLAVALVLAVVSLVRAVAGTPDGAADATAAGPGAASDAGGAAADDTAQDAPDAETPDADEDDGELVRTGTVGDGAWTLAAPADAAAASPSDGAGAEEPEVRTYAVRVEGGIGIDADEAADEIAAVLADPRGWQELEDVRFVQVADPADAAMTLSIASPPTVDEMCLPARTGGRWSCRIGEEVALNSDRWLHATPTYDDLALYRAYMINHEVGHFLGHDHRTCPAPDAEAPVMLQQSIDLQGCTPNAWPSIEA